MTTTKKALDEATRNRDAVRSTMNAAKPGSRTWRAAAEDLNFWQGKVAMLAPLCAAGHAGCDFDADEAAEVLDEICAGKY